MGPREGTKDTKTETDFLPAEHAEGRRKGGREMKARMEDGGWPKSKKQTFNIERSSSK
jgi:hypothetical protein